MRSLPKAALRPRLHRSGREPPNVSPRCASTRSAWSRRQTWEVTKSGAMNMATAYVQIDVDE